MKYVCFGVIIILFISLLVCIYFVHNIEEESSLKKSVFRLLTSVMLNVMFYGMAIMTVNDQMALLFYGIFYVCVAYMVMSLARFVFDMVFPKKWPKPMSIIMLICIVADVICMVENYIAGEMFRVQEYKDSMGNIYYSVFDRTAWYNVHLYICYFFVSLSFVLLIIGQIRAPKIFRRRYRAILILMVIASIINGIFLRSQSTFDYSMIAYACLSIAVTYLSFYYIPNGLIENMLALFIKMIDDGVICFDLNGKCIFVNERIRSMYNVNSDVSLVAFEKRYYEWLQEKGFQNLGELEWDDNPTIDGKEKHYHLEYKKIMYEGRDIGNFVLAHDRTEEIEHLEHELYNLNHDPLTGLYQRQHFYREAKKMLEKNTDKQYLLLCTDIRDFKIVNDIYGDDKGDQILIKVAEIIRQRADDSCVYGRLSGDRFASLVPKDKFDESETRKDISRMELVDNGSNFRVRVNLGIYEIDNINTPISVMCDRAIMAIKSIKDEIGTRIAYYDEKLRSVLLKEQGIIGQFHDALESGQFCFYLQPQISADGVVRGGEALVRWIHPEKGMIPPGEFIEVFERTGLISELDYYIWEKACIQLRDWRKQGHFDFYISVNISPRDFYYMDIYKVFTGLIHKYGIEARNLRLEITETAVMTDMKKVIALVNKLRKYGFIVEMDDFGSGYSSLNMLKDIHMDTIKLDMGFLRKTLYTERSMAIIRNVIKLSKQLGMEVISEGVETIEQVESLSEMGCDLFQGYYFAKPMSVWDYEDQYVLMSKGD